MRVLIVGAKGQLGFELQSVYADCDAIPYDLENVDITDQDAVLRTVNSLKPGLVLNAAAFTKVDECEFEGETALKANALGPFHLAQACAQVDAPLVHISTNYVFDGQKNEPYIESDSPHPINAYGISKVAGDYYVQSAWKKHFIVRVAGLFGPVPNLRKGINFVETMLHLGRERDELRVVNDEHLTPTYTKHIGPIIRRIVETGEYGIYHACNTDSCSWHEFTREIARQAGLAVDVQAITAAEFAAPAHRPKNGCLANQRLIDMGMEPLPTWREALKDYLREREAFIAEK